MRNYLQISYIFSSQYKRIAFKPLYHFLSFFILIILMQSTRLTRKFKWSYKLPGLSLLKFNGILDCVILIILIEWFQLVGNTCWFIHVAVTLTVAYSSKELFVNVWSNNELGKYAIRIFVFFSTLTLFHTIDERRWSCFPLLILFGYWHRSLGFARPTSLFASF